MRLASGELDPDIAILEEAVVDLVQGDPGVGLVVKVDERVVLIFHYA